VIGIQPGVGPGPTFNYGMNQRINFNLPAPANVPETPFKITQAVNPSAFVVFSEQRVHASEIPRFGSNPADLSSTYNWCNRFSGRHTVAGTMSDFKLLSPLSDGFSGLGETPVEY
jgi:hypothetical protein